MPGAGPSFRERNEGLLQLIYHLVADGRNRLKVMILKSLWAYTSDLPFVMDPYNPHQHFRIIHIVAVLH